MLYQDILIRDLAAKYKRDPRVIAEIVYSPLRFAKKVMNDDTDERAVRVRYFGVFTQKYKDNKKSRMEKLLKDLREDIVMTANVMAAILHFPMKDGESAKKIIDAAEESNDYEKIKMIWDALKEYKGNK